MLCFFVFFVCYLLSVFCLQLVSLYRTGKQLTAKPFALARTTTRSSILRGASAKAITTCSCKINLCTTLKIRPSSHPKTSSELPSQKAFPGNWWKYFQVRLHCNTVLCSRFPVIAACLLAILKLHVQPRQARLLICRSQKDGVSGVSNNESPNTTRWRATATATWLTKTINRA